MKFYCSRYSTPSAWETFSSNSRNQNALSFLKVDGLRVKYVGPGETDSQAATIIANHPVPMDCPLFYFEITVNNRGRDGFIGIGFQTDDVLLGRLPGWEAHSYGYHGDDGHCFAGNTIGNGRGQAYGPKYSTGDVIGCLLNRTNQTISYYKNGTCLGVAFRDMPEERLHPSVGLRTQAEEVNANFGGQPFVTDFQSVLDAYKEQVAAEVASTPIPLLSSLGTPLLPQLLHDHLLHHRCPQTAAIILRDMLRPQGPSEQQLQESSSGGASAASSVSQDVAGRQLVFDLVSAGRIEAAVAEVTRIYTRGPLDDNPALDFRLKVAQFCELLRSGGSGAAGLSASESSTKAALAFGRTVLAPHRPLGTAEEELLSDALSLLAYDVPEASPYGHLLGQAARDALAEALNSSILKFRGLPAVSPLERVFQQASVTLDQLKQQNRAPALTIDLRKTVFKTEVRKQPE